MGMLKALDQRHNAEVFSKKQYKQSLLKIFAKRRRSQKKGLRPQIRNFSTKFVHQNFFSQVFWSVLRRNNIAHDLGPFSTCHKVVLSSSRGHIRGLAGFKAKDFKLCP